MGAIFTTLELVRQKLNESFKNAHPRTDDWVVLSNIVDQEGRPNEDAKQKIVMLLANIQNEAMISTYNRTVPTDNDHFVAVAPPLYVDLYVLFFANFENKNYTDGLEMISETISFFQQNPWFTPDNLPGLDPEIKKLAFEFSNLEMTDLNYLMGMLGAKYLPSVYYKVRLIPFQSGAMKELVPGVRAVDAPGDLSDVPTGDPDEQSADGRRDAK
jgi:hypothetical protein